MGAKTKSPAFSVGTISLTTKRRLWIASDASRSPRRNSGWMSAAWGTFTRSVSPTWTFSSFCSDSLITMALKGCSPVLSRRGAAFPAQKVKKFSVTPRMFTLDARVCVCGATIVPFSKIAETVFCRSRTSGGKKRSARRACWIVPSRSFVKLRRLPSHRISDNQCPRKHTCRHSRTKRDDEMYLPKIFEIFNYTLRRNDVNFESFTCVP